MKFFKLIFLLGLVVFIEKKVQAQNSCPQTLKKAQDTYDEGRISEVPDILDGCLKSKDGFTKVEKISAYKLLTLTWLYFNERTKAEETMHNFLVLNPEYEINEALDPTEFINLYNSFRTTPVLIYGFKVGLNRQNIGVIRDFSLDNSAIKRGQYKSAIGEYVGFNFEIPLQKRISLLTELNIVGKSYRYTDEILGFANISFTEKQTLAEVPVLLHINLSEKKFQPYINIGGTFGYLIADKAQPVRKDNVDGTQQDVSGPDINILKLRHKLIYSASIGAGFKVKNVISNGYLIVDLRYNIGLRNVVNPHNRTSNTDLVYNYLYVDNDFRMNSFVFSVGYALPKYKPKIKVSKAVKSEQ
ncbi:MAG TPA: porin family protein [Cytophagaceae bacterium]|jgi:hypothetical protein|nr:porin family protein [Cytophagaceae bacterium]